MIQYQKQTYVQNLNRLWCHRKNDIIFLTMWPWRHNIDDINSKLTFLKNMVNTNPQAKFGDFMTFGLGIRLGGIFAPHE